MSAPASTGQPAAGLARRESPWLAFWIASVAVFLVTLDTTMLFAAFSALRQSFPGASAADTSWVINAYSVVYAAMLVPAGGLADAHGRKKVFLGGLALFILSSAACGLAPGVGWLVSARIVQAIAAALLVPSSLSIVLDAFPIERRTMVVSLWGAVGALAAAVGPSLGSLVVATAGWQWAFYLNVPLGGFALVYGLRRLRESHRDGVVPRLDLPGMALLTLGVGALALAIVQSESPDWHRNTLIGIAAFGALALTAFAVWTRIASVPLLDPALFRHRHYRYVNLATLSFGIVFSMMFFGFFFYMTNIWHYPLALAGLAITPGPLLVIPVAVIAGRIASRTEQRKLIVAGCLSLAAASLWFIWIPGLEPNYLLHWLPGLLMSGAAVGLILPSLSSAAVSRLAPQQYAVGSAVNQATRQIGSVIGVAITVLLLGHAGIVRSDFTPLYAGMFGLALLTAVLSLPVRTQIAGKSA